MARRKRNNKIISDLLITGIADKGKAVGRTSDGQVVFVEEGAVPGDVVDVLVIRKKKSMLQGVVQEIKSYSKDRIEAPCIHFGVCGGCKWQHLSYEAQLAQKSQNVKDAIQRIAKLNPNLVQPIRGCDLQYQYRNKLEYSFSTKRWLTKEEIATSYEIHNQGALGFHKAGFFDKIIEIQTCLLQDDFSNQIRNFIREYVENHDYTYYDIQQHRGLMRNIIVRNTTRGEWMVIVVFGMQDRARIIPLMESIKEQFPNITSLNYVVNEKYNDTIFDQEIVTFHGTPYIVEQLQEVKYKIGPKSFFQTNPKQAEVLFDIAVSYADLKPSDNVYDLYTGLGSIALYIAAQVKHVTGIEEIPEAIEDAKINMAFNQIDNATFYAGDVKDILNQDFIQQHGKPDVVITDPPRQGMHENVIQTLLELKAPKIVYISCNPATQARDLALLNDSYEVIRVQPVDMFPHTHHIESVALLKLKDQL